MTTLKKPILTNSKCFFDGEYFRMNPGIKKLSLAEEEELIKDIGQYVEDYIQFHFNFISIPIPPSTTNELLHTSILASSNYQTSKKLLLIVKNSPGALIGIFSRSMCMEQGINKGSIIPYIERALAADYAVVILRPNTNSIMEEITGEKPKKHLIIGSESPEIHTLCVWENIISKCEASHIALLGYANGASLCKELYLHSVVKSDNGIINNRIRAFITIEASTIIETDDAKDIHDALGRIAVNLECNQAPRGYLLEYRRTKIGCTSISLGMPSGMTEVMNVANSTALALNPVFQYLQLSEATLSNLSSAYADMTATDNGLNPLSAVVITNPNIEDDDSRTVTNSTESNSTLHSRPISQKQQPGFFRRIFGGAKTNECEEDEAVDAKLTVEDFDLIKIVGKGAFGKVLLVKKKKGYGSGKIFAMKILKKSMIIEKNQVEHAKSERDILFEIKHPFIVRLRFAFQSDEKLYLVTDYYNGGTLFFHLRKSLCFPESRAKFYASELLLALDHLHNQDIVYRDLKLENVLLDHVGHIALTDFGLSKQDIDKAGGATTFCGTPDYVAPELLRGMKYGKTIDWWSFGVLLYEMIHGQTPFYDKNRKNMFQRIISTDASIPSTFSPQAKECMRGLLTRDPSIRLGSANGAIDIMTSRFFATIDFVALLKKEIPPPFKPDVSNELDTKYVPKFFLDTKAVDSIDKSRAKSKQNDVNFDAFTYQGEGRMDA